MLAEMNGYQHFHGCELECEAEETAISSRISRASSVDSEGLIGDGSDAVEAVKTLLQGLGEDLRRPGLIKTPLRVARAFAFATKGYRQSVKDLLNDALFPEAGIEVGAGFAGGLGGMVVIRSIDQYSLCGSCLLPFKTCCHIAYISSGYKVVGLSKLARVADMFARRLQNPQTLANQICQGLADTIKPMGVAVVLQSWHLPVPGYHSDTDLPNNVFQHSTLTSAGKGQFEDRGGDAWAYFLAFLRLEGIYISNKGLLESSSSAKKTWCPCAKFGTEVVDTSHSTVGLCNDHSIHSNGNLEHSDGMNGSSNDGPHVSCLRSKEKFSAMVEAVAVLLEVFVGPFVKDLYPLAKRYVQWLLLFKRGHQLSGDNGRMNVNGGRLSKILNNDELSLSSHGFGVTTQLDVPFYSLCEHHLLPFFGKAHIGYLSSEVCSEDVDRNVVLEIVNELGQKLQVQERLTREIAEAVSCRFSLSSIIVILEASHVCLVSRGVEKLGSSTATDAVLGKFATSHAAKTNFILKVLQSKKVRRTL